MKYFKPINAEYFSHWTLLFAGDDGLPGGRTHHSGAEALRRSSTHFSQFARSRIHISSGLVKPAPWIEPLLLWVPIDEGNADVEPPEIYLCTHGFYLSDRGLDLFSPFLNENVEVLPAEVVDSPPLHYLMLPSYEEALDIERTEISPFGIFWTPHLRRHHMPNSQHIFRINPLNNIPIMSEPLVDAIRQSGLRYFEFVELQMR